VLDQFSLAKEEETARLATANRLEGVGRGERGT